MQAADDPRPAESPVIPLGPVHCAAQLRKQFRGELRRVAAEVSLYIDGPRGVTRLRLQSQDGAWTRNGWPDDLSEVARRVRVDGPAGQERDDCRSAR